MSLVVVRVLYLNVVEFTLKKMYSVKRKGWRYWRMRTKDLKQSSSNSNTYPKREHVLNGG